MTAPAVATHDRFGRSLTTPSGHRVAYQPFEGFQSNVLAAREFEVGAGGGKGCGKTDLIPVWLLQDTHHERYKGLALRRTFRELQEMMDRMCRLYMRLPTARRPYWNGEESRWNFPSGAKIVCGYMDQKADLQNYQGKEWTRVGYDEVGNQPDESVWDGLISEIRSPDPSLHRAILGTWNWGFAGHAWLYRRFYLACDKGKKTHWRKMVLETGETVYLSRRFFPGTVRDNPVYYRDPLYMAQLQSLPERQRRLLLDGDPEAAGGLALEELRWEKHIVPAFDPPRHWTTFGAFDWGFAHRFAFGWYAVNEDGRMWCCDTVWGHGLTDSRIVERVKNNIPIDRLAYTHAGHDCWHEIKARENHGPTTADRFAAGGILLSKAITDRVQGLNNLRHYLAWQGIGPDGSDAIPQLVFMDTPGNRKLYGQLEQLVVDPDDPRDVLKVDASPEKIEDPEDTSGDDGYDELRYGAASRPFRARPTAHEHSIGAFDKAALEHERERTRRSQPGKGMATFARDTAHFGELAG